MCKKEKSEKENSDSMDENMDVDMEEGKRHMAEMPNLPKPLTLEEKKFLLAVERGDINTTRKMMQKAHRHPDYMNMNCVDPLGRGALHMSISNENLEMVEMLVVMGVETRDALLHAIDAEFVEAVEVLLEHEEVIHKEGDIYSWEKADHNTSAFTPEITPLILAAHRDNYEILKILLDRGATLPMPHDIRCGCPECIKTSSEDSLRHSRSRINAYRALASPSLIALSSTDPILTAFELSLELKNLAYTEHEFRAEYLELRAKCMSFAEELLGHARSSMELAVMLNHDPDSVVPYEDGEHMMLKRLELAIDYKQKKFVAHPNIQQLLAALWYEGLPGFRRMAVVDKCLEIMKVVVLFPFYCMWYVLSPESDVSKRMRTPFMKFLTHSASYLFFLLLLILVSVRFENLVIWLFGTERMRRNLEESMRRQRGNLPTPVECVVVLWVFGFLWEEVKEIRAESLHKYIKNMWNLLDILRDGLYVITMLLRLFAYIQQMQEIARVPSTAFIPREEWDTFDPQLISEGLFAAANILSALKLVHIFSINPYLGPLQISLGRMVIDIVKFFFIYTLVLFAFACGLTQLLWYYNDLEKQKCYSLPGGLPDWTKQGEACMKWRRFHNLFEASQSLFWAGFGMVGLEDFELTGIREYTRFWSMLMFGSYSVINIIVLLNLLIAMMSSSYSFIVEHADTEWKFARTKLWMSYFEEGNTLPPPFNIFPTFKGCMRLLGKNSRKAELVRRMSSRVSPLSRDMSTKFLFPVRSQIGSGDDKGRESLKVAMERARRKMEEGTPDGSPGSSRGCSPFPDLYTGPHLLDAIRNLDLSPNASPSETPMPTHSVKPWSPPTAARDGQAKDPNMLTVPGRRSSTTLKTAGEDVGALSLDVPVNVVFKDSFKKFPKKGENGAAGPKPPATVTTVSEKVPPQKGKDEARVQKKEASERSVPHVKTDDTSAAPKPSQIKASGVLPTQQNMSARPGASALKKLPPPSGAGPRRGPESEHALRRPAPARTQQVQQQTFTGSEELETMDFVRRPSKPPTKQDSDEKRSPPPAITVIPSTPKPPETPVKSYIVDSLPQKPHVKPSAPQPKDEPVASKAPIEKAPAVKAPAEKAPAAKAPAEKPPADKAPAPKAPVEKAPAEKTPAPGPCRKGSCTKDPCREGPCSKGPSREGSCKGFTRKAPPKATLEKASSGGPEQKPSTPPAAAFQSNMATHQTDPLLTPTEEKKGGWL
ncbi:LOW QUALITY PROTEIN: transient-receptor-potential-like protein [Panulirus ornatus]|uniref:LOW QUALITY PROTEIN: transient-receptor-potential-like protein n=1 Tax=Panulirus ornatus TaxID=150431 RepID=UPI003A889894